MSAAAQESDEKPAVRKRAPRKPKVRPPEEFTVLAPESKVTIEAGGEQFLSVEEFRKKLSGPPEGTYPEGTELFSFTPSSGGDAIWFPLNGFPMPGAVWMWELYDKPFHVQSWEWMKRANIPRHMQRKAVELEESNIGEYMDMFEQWFKALSGGSATQGES